MHRTSLILSVGLHATLVGVGAFTAWGLVQGREVFRPELTVEPSVAAVPETRVELVEEPVELEQPMDEPELLEPNVLPPLDPAEWHPRGTERPRFSESRPKADVKVWTDAVLKVERETKTDELEAAEAPVPPSPAAAYVPAKACSDNPAPKYPKRSRRPGREQEGVVVVGVRIALDGSVADAWVAESSRFGLLDREAVRTVKLWRFEPATRDGKAVDGETQVEIEFRMTDQAAR